MWSESPYRFLDSAHILNLVHGLDLHVIQRGNVEEVYSYRGEIYEKSNGIKYFVVSYCWYVLSLVTF